MKKFAAALIIALPAWAQAAYTPPDITVTETPDAFGGSYTVTIIQPPAEVSPPSYLVAWGITNQEATGVDTGLTGWTSSLFSDDEWDSGLYFETFTPGDPIYLFETGASGIGDFGSVFGPGFSQAAVFWLDSYTGYPGLVATSSNFNWLGSEPDSTAFAILQSGSDSYACSVTVLGSSAGGGCSLISAVPLPAAAWLFGSALLGLAAVGRRRAG